MELEISTDRSRLDRDLIYRFLSEESYWAKGIARDLVERAIDNSYCFGTYIDGRQMGFARLVTDFARFGYLADVFILPEYRGHGYGKALISTIMADPELGSIARLLLFTRDAHGLYEQYGFESVTDPRRVMVWQRPSP